MAIDYSIGGVNSNSYQSVAAVTTLLLERAGDTSAWTDLASNAPQQEAIAITATRRLEQEQYDGYKVSSGQALQFPRADLPDPKNGNYPNYYALDAIPMPVLLAHAELCLQLSNNPELFDDTGLEPFSSFSKGDLSLTMRGDAAGKLPAQVSRYLRGIRVGSYSVIRVQRA